MPAEVIMLPNAKCTEMPVAEERDQAYVLELEQENLELRDALASSELRVRRARVGYRGFAISAAILAAFGVGWLLEPPRFGLPSAQAAESPVADRHADVPRSTWPYHRPRLLDEDPIQGRSV